MFYPDTIIIILLKRLVQLIRERNRAVFSSRTSDADHKLCLSFLYIIRNQKFYHIRQFCKELPCFVIIHNIFSDFSVITTLWTKFIYVIRIRKKSYIKYQICICRDSIFEPKRQHRYIQILIFLIFHKNLRQLCTQFSGQHMTAVNQIICPFS